MEGLVNEVVIRNILQMLPLKDLNNCRLINPLWNRLCIPFLKQKCRAITFGPGFGERHLLSGENMERLIELIEKNPDFPYVKLELDITREHFTPAVNQKLIILLRNLSPILEELSIHHTDYGEFEDDFDPANPEPTFPTIEMPEDIIFPNLKEVKLQPERESVLIPPYYQFVSKIMRNAQNIRRLELTSRHVDATGHLIQTLKDCGNRKVSSLMLKTEFEANHFYLLREVGLKLNVLHLEFFNHCFNDAEEEGKLTRFLESQAETLENLSICPLSSFSGGEQGRIAFSVRFPRLRKVKSLRIFMFNMSLDMELPTLSYKNQFPFLRKFEFTKFEGEIDDLLHGLMEPLNTLEELRIPYSKPIKKEHVIEAARIFPNLKALEIHGDLEVMNAVYTFMLGLEELRFFHNDMEISPEDCVVTGLSLEKCLELRDAPEEMFRRFEEQYPSPAVMATKSLSSLTRLKTLRFIGGGKRGDDSSLAAMEEQGRTFSNISARLVLAKMQSLKLLDMGGRGTDMISGEVLTEMRRRMVILG